MGFRRRPDDPATRTGRAKQMPPNQSSDPCRYVMTLLKQEHPGNKNGFVPNPRGSQIPEPQYYHLGRRAFTQPVEIQEILRTPAQRPLSQTGQNQVRVPTLEESSAAVGGTLQATAAATVLPQAAVSANPPRSRYVFRDPQRPSRSRICRRRLHPFRRSSRTSLHRTRSDRQGSRKLERSSLHDQFGG